MALDKHRFRFRKDGDLRFVSHLDLMRAFERLLRRSQLPYRSTEGFHPQPRVIFAMAMSLGIAGLEEVVEIEWTESVEPDEAFARLSLQVPPGLTFLSVKRITLKQSARPRRVVYRLPLPASLTDSLRTRCAAIMEASELWVEREKPKPREVNIRSYLHDLRVGTNELELDVWVTQDGSARADEIVRALELNHLLDEGAVLERTVLEIEDETDASSCPRPALPGRDDRYAIERPLKHSPANLPLMPAAMMAHWGASPSGPIME